MDCRTPGFLVKAGWGVSRQENPAEFLLKAGQGGLRPPGGQWGMRNWLDIGGYQTCGMGWGAVLTKTGKCRDIAEVQK